MAKVNYYFAKNSRLVEIPISNLDEDNVALIQLPRGLIESVRVSVDDAFNTGATLVLKVNGTTLVSAHALDATGYTEATLATFIHDTAKELNLTATVSDKTAVGAARVIVSFSIERDTKL